MTVQISKKKVDAGKVRGIFAVIMHPNRMKFRSEYAFFFPEGNDYKIFTYRQIDVVNKVLRTAWKNVYNKIRIKKCDAVEVIKFESCLEKQN